MSAAEPSLEPPSDAVKEAKLGQKSRPGRPLLPRLLEGWELGAITVGLVLAAALLAVPRAAEPGVFPVPLIDEAEARASRERLSALADRAEREGLPFETRAVGDGMRRLGAALASGSGDIDHLQRTIAERLRLAMVAEQLEPLLRLRAVQARLFARGVRAHVWGSKASPELAALGGDFVERATRNGWLTADGCIASDDELQTLFARRWTEVTGLRDEPHFKATLGEMRRYYRFLLLHPERSAQSDQPLAQERASRRLRYVEALSHYDTEYPLRLARGSLLAELGRMPESASALSDYLGRSAGKEWNLRARNYLLYAADQSKADADELLPTEQP
jgi:hypothetical protein